MAFECRQQTLRLGRFDRGIHLISGNVLRGVTEVANCKAGLIHLHLLHTSCGLALNENASPNVRSDLERFFDKLVPEREGDFEHVEEGLDDMPAHVKSVLSGTSLTLPVSHGRPVLGTWQGIYLCEYRRSGGERRLVATILGDF
jgi:secondary thiamine-phosphate synthase enzyme